MTPKKRRRLTFAVALVAAGGVLAAGIVYELGQNTEYFRSPSDIAVGRLAKERFLATIEPWHGNQVAVYRRDGEAWARQTIDETLADGHTVLTTDLNGDGNDEIIAGCRGGPRSVYIYSAEDAAGRRWNRQILDGDMPAASCAVGDLNGDGRPDIACIGSATGTLKWYENRPPKP